MPILAFLAVLLFALPALADIPATPVMTLYRFNGPATIPYYDAAEFRRSGTTRPAGALAQGSSVIPCLMIMGGEPLTDASGVPYVGFQVVVDAANGQPADYGRFQSARKRRQEMRVANHHCPADTRYVMDIRNLYDMSRPPFFEPPPAKTPPRRTEPKSTSDRIVRAFHNSPQCAAVNRRLTGRRAAMAQAWQSFMREQGARIPAEQLNRARHLDYTMRTAIFEGHLGRGCNAYGTCERNIIALSIRNRARETCLKHHACAAPGDFTSVSSAVSQYNIWDETIAQTSGLTGCFLRDQGGAGPEYALFRNLYEQNVSDVERILYGSDADLMEIFPGNDLNALKGLKNYYHAPAMGKCFPQYERVEYMSGAVARNGNDFALIADTRIKVGERLGNGYLFQSFKVRAMNNRDEGSAVNTHPGFVVDGRRVSLKPPTRCAPYGIPPGCGFPKIGRYRKTPTWVNEGRPMEVQCRVSARGEKCHDAPSRPIPVWVGGTCDVEMRPFTGIR